MIPRTRALELINQHIATENIKKHLYATEALMRALARKFNEDENRWGIAGLLHDIDWDMTKPDPRQHGLVGYEMMQNEDMDEEMRTAIKKHNYMLELEPETLLEKALYVTESMTGFIVAVTLMQPTKKLADVKVSSILKKWKDKKFAGGVNREIVEKCESMLGMSLEEVTTVCLEAMQGIHEEMGL